MSAVTHTDTTLAIRDRYFAPSLLSPFAGDMARRLSRLSMGPLLEINADTGVLTQAIASAMSANLTIIATDPDAVMISYASAKPGMARVTWQTAEAGALPFAAATFGIVACHFAVAAMSDRAQAFRDVRRVMKPNGRFVFSVPGSMRHNPVAACLQGALDELHPTHPPRFVERGLHGYHDTEAIDDELTAAGFTEAIYTVVELPFAAASARDVAIGYCLGTSLRQEIGDRPSGDEVEQAVDAATAALEKRFGTGPIQASMRAQIVSAAG